MSKNKGPNTPPKLEANDMDRRNFFKKTYSSAMVTLVFGGSAVSLGGCDDASDNTNGEGEGGSNGVCSDTCSTARNGVCEDGGLGSSKEHCSWGSDCDDCGTRYSSSQYADNSSYSNYSSGYYGDSSYSNSYSNYYSDYSDYSDYYDYYDYYSISYYDYFSNSW